MELSTLARYIVRDERTPTGQYPPGFGGTAEPEPADRDCYLVHASVDSSRRIATEADAVPRWLVTVAAGELLEAQGLLLESAKGPIPNVAQLVAGERITGSWWGHPAAHEIFEVINELADSPDVARMRLVKDKVTLVHRRLWPALLRLAARFDDAALLVVTQEHTPTGAHRATSTPLHDWVAARGPRRSGPSQRSRRDRPAPAGPARSAQRRIGTAGLTPVAA